MDTPLNSLSGVGTDFLYGFSELWSFIPSVFKKILPVLMATYYLTKCQDTQENKQHTEDGNGTVFPHIQRAKGRTPSPQDSGRAGCPSRTVSDLPTACGKPQGRKTSAR